MIKTMKDTPPGFLSHYLPSRKSGKGRFFDSLGIVMMFFMTILFFYMDFTFMRYCI